MANRSASATPWNVGLDRTTSRSSMNFCLVSTQTRSNSRLTGCAFAVEERTVTPPVDLATALAAPLSYRWGRAAAKMAALVTRAEVPSIEVIAELNGVLEKHGG